MNSPWVARNLDCAQYAQPRGSQYEGPAAEPTWPDIDETGWDEPIVQLDAECECYACIQRNGRACDGYGPCAQSPDTSHTWSMCEHIDGTVHAACVYCHLNY